MRRWMGFLIVIGLGIGLGLFYGWVVNPIEYVDTSPDTLRIDYKTDYVLMVAEAYHSDGNLELAKQRLAFLGDTPLDEMVVQASIFAQTNGYLDSDLVLIRALSDALQAENPGQETPTP